MNVGASRPEAPPPFFTSCREHGSSVFAAGGGTMILMYHRLGRAPWRARSRALYVPGALLRGQLRDLAAAGIPALPLAEAVAGEGGFSVTFDDGFRSVGLGGAPILQAAGVRATLFLVAGLLGKTNRWDCPPAGGEPEAPLMDEHEIRDWLAAGQDIGSHTLTHPRLPALPLARARAEIADSKKLLEDRFGRPVAHFCYPFGAWDERVRNLVEEAGYAAACTTEPGLVHPGGDPLSLPRLLARPRPLPGIVGNLGRALRRLTVGR